MSGRIKGPLSESDKVYETFLKAVFQKLFNVHSFSRPKIKKIIQDSKTLLEGFFNTVGISLEDLSSEKKDIFIDYLASLFKKPLPPESTHKLMDIIKLRLECGLKALLPPKAHLSNRVFLEGETLTVLPDGRIKKLFKLYTDLGADIPSQLLFNVEELHPSREKELIHKLYWFFNIHAEPSIQERYVGSIQSALKETEAIVNANKLTAIHVMPVLKTSIEWMVGDHTDAIHFYEEIAQKKFSVGSSLAHEALLDIHQKQVSYASENIFSLVGSMRGLVSTYESSREMVTRKDDFIRLLETIHQYPLRKPMTSVVFFHPHIQFVLCKTFCYSGELKPWVGLGVSNISLGFYDRFSKTIFLSYLPEPGPNDFRGFKDFPTPLILGGNIEASHTRIMLYIDELMHAAAHILYGNVFNPYHPENRHSLIKAMQQQKESVKSFVSAVEQMQSSARGFEELPKSQRQQFATLVEAVRDRVFKEKRQPLQFYRKVTPQLLKSYRQGIMDSYYVVYSEERPFLKKMALPNMLVEAAADTIKIGESHYGVLLKFGPLPDFAGINEYTAIEMIEDFYVTDTLIDKHYAYNQWVNEHLNRIPYEKWGVNATKIIVPDLNHYYQNTFLKDCVSWTQANVLGYLHYKRNTSLRSCPIRQPFLNHCSAEHGLSRYDMHGLEMVPREECRNDWIETSGARSRASSWFGMFSSIVRMPINTQMVAQMCEVPLVTLKEQIITESTEAISHGAVRGASKVVESVVQRKYLSREVGRIGQQAVYYSGMGLVSFWSRYSQTSEEKPVMDRMSHAACQAVWDVGTLMVTHKAIQSVGKVAGSISKKTIQWGMHRTGLFFKSVQNFGQYGIYAYKAWSEGTLATGTAIAVGSLTEKAVVEVGKRVFRISGR